MSRLAKILFVVIGAWLMSLNPKTAIKVDPCQSDSYRTFIECPGVKNEEMVNRWVASVSR